MKRKNILVILLISFFFVSGWVKLVYITEGMTEITVLLIINGVAVTEIGSFSIIEIEDKAGNKKKNPKQFF